MILITIVLFTVVTTLFITGVFACGCGGGSSYTPSNTHIGYAPMIMVPPMPQYETMWKAEAVIDSFAKKGLPVEKPKFTFEGLDMEPDSTIKEEAVSFDMPAIGKDVGGSINTFEFRSDLNKLQEHFLDLNKKGDLNTWSFVKDNVLLILTGNVPEKIARQYETALLDLKK